MKLCEFCKRTFPRYCDLEDHIETLHSNEKRFNCSKCGKTFVTKWRLEKHGNLHSSQSTKACKYYVEGVSCPFEKLGCKFLHVEIESHNRNNFDSVDESMNATHSDNRMKTSTPKSTKRKILKCSGYCSMKDQCANCIAKEMLKNGGISLEGSFIY